MPLFFGEITALLTAIFWTATSLLFEQASKRIGSLNVNLIRLVMAFLLLTLFMGIWQGTPLPLHAAPASWFWLSLSGLIGFFIGDMLLFEAFVLVGARIAMLIYTTVPLITALLGWFFMKESLGIPAWCGMLITLGGIAVVVLKQKQDGGKKTLHHLPGVLLALGGAIGQACGLIFSKIGMQDLSAFAATQIRIIPAILCFLLLFLFRGGMRKPGAFLKDKKALLFTFAGSFFGPFLGVSFSLLAIRYANTAVAATIMALVPVLIIIPSVLIFKEKAGWLDAIGAAAAIGGTVLLFF